MPDRNRSAGGSSGVGGRSLWEIHYWLEGWVFVGSGHNYE